MNQALFAKLKKVVPEPAHKGVFEEGQDWTYDRYLSATLSRNRWMLIGIVALVLALLQAIALVGLTPLKSIEPFVIREEVNSGSVTVLRPVKDSTSFSENEALRKYFLNRYVVTRETFDPADVETNYNNVLLMTDQAAGRDFAQFAGVGNTASPINVYGPRRIKRFIRVRSISFIDQRTATVRFAAFEKQADSPEKISYWIATAAYRFVNSPASEDERLVNPLGFLITSYRVDQETTR